MHTSQQPRGRTAVRAAWSIALGGALALGAVVVAGAATTPSTPPGGGRLGPAAFGSVAALSAATSSMEVQNQRTGQTTVSWTSTTTFSQIATVPASSVAVGDCVTISASQSNKTLTARTVTISQASSSGNCTGGFQRASGSGGSPGGAGQFFRNRRPGTPPSGSFPRSGNFANFGFASGQVTNVTSSALTLTGFSSLNRPKPTTKPGSKPTTRPTRPAATTVRVNLATSTIYNQNQSASASNLAVGDCITAAGTSASNGAVTASTIRITSTGGQSCTGGGQFFRAGGPPPAGA